MLPPGGRNWQLIFPKYFFGFFNANSEVIAKSPIYLKNSTKDLQVISYHVEKPSVVRNCLPDPQGPKVVDVADVLNRVVPVVLFWHTDHHLIAGPNVRKLFTTVSYAFS